MSYDLAGHVADVSDDQNWYQLCLKFVRSALGIRGGVADAREAYQLGGGASGSNTSDVPPAGVPVYWDTGRHGHIALSAGGGYVWSNDIRRKGSIDLVPISEITNTWHAPYLGYQTTLNGQQLPTVSRQQVTQAGLHLPDVPGIDMPWKGSWPGSGGDVKDAAGAVKDGALAVPGAVGDAATGAAGAVAGAFLDGVKTLIDPIAGRFRNAAIAATFVVLGVGLVYAAGWRATKPLKDKVIEQAAPLAAAAAV